MEDRTGVLEKAPRSNELRADAFHTVGGSVGPVLLSSRCLREGCVPLSIACITGRWHSTSSHTLPIVAALFHRLQYTKSPPAFTLFSFRPAAASGCDGMAYYPASPSRSSMVRTSTSCCVALNLRDES